MTPVPAFEVACVQNSAEFVDQAWTSRKKDSLIPRDILLSLHGPCTADSIAPFLPLIRECLQSLISEVCAEHNTAEGDDPPRVPTVHLRTTLCENLPDLVDLLLSFGNLAVVHVVAGAPDRHDRSGSSTAGKAFLASLAQAGFPIAVEIEVDSADPCTLLGMARDWVVVSRGGGLILAPGLPRMPVEDYVSRVLDVYDAQLVPSHRLAPVNSFIESIGGTPAAVPFWMGPDAAKSQSTLASDQCTWRFLCAHWCGAAPEQQGDWHKQVAALLYPRLLLELGQTLVERQNGSLPAPGERLRAMMKDGAMVFLNERKQDGFQMAPDPRTLEPPTDLNQRI